VLLGRHVCVRTDNSLSFILEGLVTAVAGIAMKFWLVDWPETASFLTEEERAVLFARLSKDRREEATMNKWNTKRVFGDWKIWLGYILKLRLTF
jgi:hypothetical protein